MAHIAFRRVALLRAATAHSLGLGYRSVHQAPNGLSTKSNLKPLFNQPTLTFLKNYQKSLVENVNRLTANTEYESCSMMTIVRKAAKQPRQAATFNYASQAWNLDFFLNSLTPETRSIPPELEAAILDEYRSLESFRDEFKNHALAIFGSGWTWLVQNKAGRLAIMNTYNAGTVLAREREDTKDASVHPDDPQATGLIEPFYKDNYYMNVGVGTILQGGASTTAMGENVPLLALNMWEHAYLREYGLDRAKYIDNFFQTVNWDLVASRIPRVTRQI